MVEVLLTSKGWLFRMRDLSLTLLVAPLIYKG